MATCRVIEVKGEDDGDHYAPKKKWKVSLTEEVFKRFMGVGNPIVNKVFGEGSFFSPLLFGKFFDPCDAFPLWDFEADVLLSNLRTSSKTNVDWSETNEAYLLKTEFPGIGINTVGVGVNGEKGKIMEISGQWKKHHKEDWATANWWEYGYVRRVELPLDADSHNIEAHLTNDLFLELRIPKLLFITTT
ncbi:21.7 kDa class VI heat shock protein [Euphorbia peplus]|nr:21.7 kDa class VI heat shock protein [Euphorbia peplus]